MNALQLVPLLSFILIITVVLWGISDFWKFSKKWDYDREEKRKAIYKVIQHMIEQPDDTKCLSKNFSLYTQKIVARNEKIYLVKLYEDLFELYWLVYIYHNDDDSLAEVKYCQRGSDAANRLMALIDK